MIGSLARLAIAMTATALGAALASTTQAEPYYTSKVIRLIVNFEAGGAADIEARLFAQYLAGLIEGQPRIVVQNISGAGGMVGTNAVGRGAKDGLMLGYLTGPGGKAAFEPQSFQGIPFSSYEIVGYLPGSAIYYVRTDVPPGIKTPADILKAQNIYAGGLETGSNKDLTDRKSVV
jgi:tripartite-type tricarboxylate transporter receptor subunit TctC